MVDLLKKTEKNEKNIFQSYIDKNKVLLPLVLLSLFLFISIFCKYFIFVAIFSILIYIVCYKINGLYYILFCIPLINIFSYDNIKFNQLAIVVSFYLVIVGIFFILDLIKKNKKINYTSTSLLIAILIIYFCQLRRSNIINSLGIISGLFIVYFVSNYSEKLSFKKLILCYIFGVIFSVFLGLFREISPRLSSLTVISYAYSSKRFCGVSNPNVLAGHLMIALGLLYYLVLEKKIKYLFYPIYFTLFTTLLFTISKSGMINFCCISLLFLICYLVKNFKLKNIIKVVVTLFLSVIIFLSMYSITKVYIDRFVSVFRKKSEIENTINQNNVIQIDNNYNNFSNQEKTEQVLDELTTGRFSLWKNYLIKTFKTIKTALFGYGINAPFTEETLGGLITNPHNTFIQILYYNGLVTAILLVLFIVFCINPKKLDRRYIYILIPILGLALYLCGDIMYSYSLFAIISIFVLCLRNGNDVLNEIIISRESVGI